MNAFNIIMIAIGICAAAVLAALLKGAIAAGKDKSRDTAKCPICGKVLPLNAEDENKTLKHHIRPGTQCGEQLYAEWLSIVPVSLAMMTAGRNFLVALFSALTGWGYFKT